MKILDLNLTEILDNGSRGKVPVMTKEEWEHLGYLINKSCETNYRQGYRQGAKDGYRREK